MKNLYKNHLFIIFLLFFSFVSLEMQAIKRLVTNGNDNTFGSLPFIPNSLRATVDIAQEGDTIVIDNTVNTIILNDGITITKSLIIVGLKLINKTIITYSNSLSNSLFEVNLLTPSGLKIIFSNVVFIGILTNTDKRVFNARNTSNNCDIRFNDCDFRDFLADNTATGDGIVIRIEKGKLTLRDCIFENNLSLGNGVISFEDITNDLIVKDCEFKNNTAKAGGAIYTQAKNTTIQWCIFDTNKATGSNFLFAFGGGDTGGAISSQSKELTVADCKFINNSTTATNASAGGGIYVSSFFNVSSIERCYFEGNKTASGSNSGGAIFLTNFSTSTTNPFTIINCTFWKNEAYEGGGIYTANPGSNPIVKIISNTFVGNIARRPFSSIPNGTLNTSSGGAVYAGNASDCYLDYNVAIENKTTAFPSSKDFVSEQGFKTQAGNNIYQTDNNVLVFNTTLTPLSILNSNLQTTTTINGFVTPQDNGGFSKTFKPDPNSILIGRTPVVGGNTSNLPKFDQRFFPRGTTIDVGACERTINPTGEVPEGVFLEITSLTTNANNGVVIEWRDRLPSSTIDYQLIKDGILLPEKITKQTGKNQIFIAVSATNFNTSVSYQIQANKQTTIFQIDKYKSQKASITLFNDAISATDTQNDKEISIYPNPCKEEFVISLEKNINQNKENNISIYSVFGQKIITQNISTQQTEVVLPQKLPAGLYFVEIKLGEKRSVKKIVIE